MILGGSQTAAMFAGIRLMAAEYFRYDLQEFSARVNWG